MKKQTILIILILVAMLMLSACTSTTESEDSAKTPQTEGLSAFVSTDIKGTDIDQSVFENYTLTMVNIWTTTCGYCIKEMPDLAKLNEDYASKGFQVVGIAADVAEEGSANLETAISIVEQTGANYIHILASDSLNQAKLSTVQYVPETIFVDSLGNQVGESHVGAKDYEGWRKIIEEYLGEVE